MWLREQDTQHLPRLGFFGIFLAQTRKIPAGGIGTLDLYFINLEEVAYDRKNNLRPGVL